MNGEQQSVRRLRDYQELIPTRQSLLSRLRKWDDQESWRDFFETYSSLIYRAAIKAGLNDAESRDVVQEVVIEVVRKMPSFHYHPEHGSFKSWLLRLTNWRIKDQFRLRDGGIQLPEAEMNGLADRIADPAGFGLEQTWNEEWEASLVDAAYERAKRKVSPRMYQVFDAHVLQEWPVEKVVRLLQVNRAYVYLSKHRISRRIERESAYLKRKSGNGD